MLKGCEGAMVHGCVVLDRALVHTSCIGSWSWEESWNWNWMVVFAALSVLFCTVHTEVNKVVVSLSNNYWQH